MKRLTRMTLKRKLHALMIAAISLALLIIVIATIIYEVTTFEPRLLQQTRTSAETLGMILRAPLEFDDRDSATLYLGTRTSNPDIAIAAVYKDDGKLFAIYQRSGVSPQDIPQRAQPDQHVFRAKHLQYWQSLNGGGHLYLLRDLPPLYARMPQYSITVGSVLVALALVGFLLHWATQHNVLAPLSTLLATSRKITEESDYRARTGITRHDEFGELANAFDRMLEVVGEREDRLRTILMNSSDIIAVLAIDGRICFQSPSLRQMLGYPIDAIIGRNGFDLVHPDDVQIARNAMLAAVASSDVISLSIRLRHADGSWRYVDATGRSLDRDIDGGRIIVNARDVTEKRNLEEQFRQSQKLDAIGQLTGGVAHDFNNLLTIISGNAMLIGTHAQLPMECRESLTEIERAAKRATDLTRQLLTFSRRQSMQLKTLNLNGVVSDLMRMLHRLLAETINVKLQLMDSPAYIHADTSMIEQVLMNLALNARDAMPTGGQLTIGTSLVQMDSKIAEQNSQAHAGTFICLNVTDSGTGIAPESLPHIFEPFFTTKAVGKGTGLGLATVYGIVQQHHGWITCSSELGKGTRFNIYLPYQTVAEAATESGTKQSEQISKSIHRATILLVEDEPNVRSLMRTVLMRQGHTLIEAESSTQAVELWETRRDHIDLLITDLVIPGSLDGITLAEHILKDRPELPVIYSSGYSAHLAGKDNPFKHGGNFLSKPFSPQELHDLVQTLLQSLSTRPAQEQLS
jgi:PAS domain S-box-containing protein